MKRKHKWLPGEKGIQGGNVYEFVSNPPGEKSGSLGKRFRLLSAADPKIQDWVGTVFWLSEKETPVPCRLRSPDEEPTWPGALRAFGIALGAFIPAVFATVALTAYLIPWLGSDVIFLTLPIVVLSHFCSYRVIKGLRKEQGL